MAPSKINVLEAVDRKVKDVFHPFIVGASTPATRRGR